MAGISGSPSGGTGNAVGAASSTDNAIVRFDGTTGKTLQNSVVTITDVGGVVLPTTGAFQQTISGVANQFTGSATGPQIAANYGDGNVSLAFDLSGLSVGANTLIPPATGTQLVSTSSTATLTNKKIKSPVRALTANATLAITDEIVTIDATSGNVTLTLPAASTAIGLSFRIKRLDGSGNTVTIARAGSDTIDGATSATLTAQYQARDISGLTSSTWGLF
jgi:limonene-1,2-epoxide hydrolase